MLTSLSTGNCLFNALSDQLYGGQNEHHMIRARVIDYMRENADYYKMFMECNAGGGVRRNPKRKNAGGYSSFNASMPTQDEIDRVFESHLDRMAKGGTWGDNMEIVAFSSAFGVDVKIYQRDNAFMVRAGVDEARPVCHIAYHVCNMPSQSCHVRHLIVIGLGALLFHTKSGRSSPRTSKHTSQGCLTAATATDTGEIGTASARD